MFESAKLKIHRAEHHIRDVSAIFTDFTNRNIPNLSIRQDAEQRPHIRVSFSEELPDMVALAIGDAIHNLRVALDHLTWEVVGRDGGTQDRHLKLPTGNNRVNFESTCNGMKTPSDAIKRMFTMLEVFPGGKGAEIYTLHLFDNADKHTVLRPTINATTISKLVLMNPDGSVCMTFNSSTTIGGDNPLGRLKGLPSGVTVKQDDNRDITSEIFFQEIEGAFPTRVIPKLCSFRDIVTETIHIFERNLSD